MRTLILIGLLIAPLPTLGQTFELGPGGFRVYPHGGGDCRELRAACIHKEELGETGQGNCQRYRELCSGGARGYYTIIGAHTRNEGREFHLPAAVPAGR